MCCEASEGRYGLAECRPSRGNVPNPQDLIIKWNYEIFASICARIYRVLLSSPVIGYPRETLAQLLSFFELLDRRIAQSINEQGRSPRERIHLCRFTRS